MNTTRILAAAALFVAAGSAFALPQEYVKADAGFTSSLSRADVVSQIKDTMNMPGAKDGSYPSVKAQAATVSTPMTPSARNAGGHADLYFGA
ncbi:MAG: hypothetical protein JWR22_686 [Herminiimonas sp.]|nr:hypothetical protein [Herminiimonas sp.]